MANGAISYPGGLERGGVTGDVFPGVPAALKRISWGAVFAGLIVTIMVSLVLALLGMGIGLGTIDSQTEANPFAGLGVGAAIWWLVSSLIALFLGGWVAGRMSGIPKPFDGAVHGVLTWGLATLLTFYLLGTAMGRLVGGVSNLVGRGISMAGQGVAAVAPDAARVAQDQLRERGLTMESIKQGTSSLLQTGKPELQPGAVQQRAREEGRTAQGAAAAAAQSPQQAEEELSVVLERMVSQAAGAEYEADREAAVNIIVNRTGKSRAEAGREVDNWVAGMQKTKDNAQQAKMAAEQKARQLGDAAASGMSKASLWAFATLLLGGGAAAFGGRTGIPKDIGAGDEARVERAKKT